MKFFSAFVIKKFRFQSCEECTFQLVSHKHGFQLYCKCSKEDRMQEAWIDSLIPAIFKSGSTTLVKNSVKQGVLAVRNAGRFSINDQYRFLDVLTLFAALLLEKIPIIEYLVGKTPYFQLKEKEVPEEKYTFILPEFADTEVLIDILELVDSVFIFHEELKQEKTTGIMT